MAGRQPIRGLAAAVAVFVVAVVVAWPGRVEGAKARHDIDFDLREEVRQVAVPSAGASIVVTSYRPRGAGPFPWIVLSHGTAVDIASNRAIGRYRNPALVREWTKRGYAVVVPVRRGYGASGGDRLGDDYGGCARPDLRRAGEGAAADVLAAVQWARGERDLDPARWMLVGQSSGAFASIYTASKRPSGLRAVLAFSPGRGGDPDKRPGQPCAPDAVARLFGSIAPQIEVPVLWFYAQNDEFIGPAAQRLWFDAFRAAGGKGDLVVVPPFAERRGHGVFPSPRGVPLWTAAVADFLRKRRVDLPF